MKWFLAWVVATVALTGWLHANAEFDDLVGLAAGSAVVAAVVVGAVAILGRGR